MRSHARETARRRRAGIRAESGRVGVRDAALRRARRMVAGIAAGAVGLSGVLSVVAAHAFKGHPQREATTADTSRARPDRVRVPGPQAVPAIGAAAPLQPPEQPPAAPRPQPSNPAPEPQVSGGS